MLNDTDLPLTEEEQQIRNKIMELHHYKSKEVPKFLNELTNYKIKQKDLNLGVESGRYEFTYKNIIDSKKQCFTLQSTEIHNPICKIILDFNEGDSDNVNHKYGTVESIEFGNKPATEGGESVQYEPAEVLEILESPRCLTLHSRIPYIYSTIILKNYNYFKEQQNGKNTNFIFPEILGEDRMIKSNKYIMDKLIAEDRTIFVPFAMDGHVVLARFYQDNKGQKHIDFIDSSGYFNDYIENDASAFNYIPKSLSTFLENKNGTPYLAHTVNDAQPQLDILPIAYDIFCPKYINCYYKEYKKLVTNLEATSVSAPDFSNILKEIGQNERTYKTQLQNYFYCEDQFLSGTCSYNTIGSANKIIKELSQNEEIAHKLITCDSGEMKNLYFTTNLYQASLEYTKKILENYLIPVHCSTKRLLTQIFNNYKLEGNNWIEYVPTITSMCYSRMNNKYFREAYVDSTNRDILIIIGPNIDPKSHVDNNIFISNQQIIGSETKIDNSVILGYGTIYNSTIDKTKILCSDIHMSGLLESEIDNSILAKSVIETSTVANRSKIYYSLIENKSKIDNSIVVNDSKINHSIVADSTIINSIIDTSDIKDRSIVYGESKIYKSTVRYNSEIINSTIANNSKINDSRIEGTTINNSHLSHVRSFGNLTIQNSNIMNNSSIHPCYIFGDDSVNLSNINLNINVGIRSDIIITTSDFLEKLKNPKNEQQYTAYLYFLKQNNIDIDELNTYNVDDNGIVILSSNKNLSFEKDQSSNTITVKKQQILPSMSNSSISMKRLPDKSTPPPSKKNKLNARHL